jgi:NH3-dependent NAD+ synthetase
MRYEELDKAIEAIESGRVDRCANKDIIAKVKKLMQASEHKRQPIAIYKKK